MKELVLQADNARVLVETGRLRCDPAAVTVAWFQLDSGELIDLATDNIQGKAAFKIIMSGIRYGRRKHTK